MSRVARRRERGWRAAAAGLLAPAALALALASPALLAARGRATDERQPGPEIRAEIDRRLPEWLALYRDLHAHPELSLEEERTAARVAERLEAAGFRVQRGVGGHGVVAVLERGSGPTLLLRGDMDALPVVEETRLPYASATGAMHACGHDLHTTHLVAVGELFAAQGGWHGTLVLVAQPAEEIGRGALAMLEDGLFERFPRPDLTLALHVEPSLPAGTLGVTRGWAGANVDAVDIAIFGRGGHGARPQQAVDPIVTAAYLVTELQTIVSRRIDPQEAAVVTVGSIHGGTKHNVIPDRVDLQLTVRSYTDEVRATLLEGIAQLARETCEGFGCPRAPEIRVRENYTPAVYNDPALARRAEAVFASAVGAERVVAVPPSMGGDDFGRLGRALGVPSLLFRLGATSRDRWQAAQEPGADPLPTLHSSTFAPDAPPALSTALQATTALLLDLFERPLSRSPAGESSAGAPQGPGGQSSSPSVTSPAPR